MRAPPWPRSPPPTCPAARRRPFCTSLCARIWNRSSPTPASTTTAGCLATSSRSFAHTSGAVTFRRASLGLTATRAATICSSRSLAAAGASARAAAGRRMANVAAHLVDRVVAGRPGEAVRAHAALRASQARRVQGRRADRARAHLRRGGLRELPRRAPGAPGSRTPGAARSTSFSASASEPPRSLPLARCSTACSRATRAVACCSTRQRRRPPRTWTRSSARTRRAAAWLRRHGYLDDSPLEARSNEPPRRRRSTPAPPSPWGAAT